MVGISKGYIIGLVVVRVLDVLFVGGWGGGGLGEGYHIAGKHAGAGTKTGSEPGFKEG